MAKTIEEVVKTEASQVVGGLCHRGEGEHWQFGEILNTETRTYLTKNQAEGLMERTLS